MDSAYATQAEDRGLQIIIAGAAHLPGMVAAQTLLPVIGVPVKILSIVQMPRGAVGTVAIGRLIPDRQKKFSQIMILNYCKVIRRTRVRKTVLEAELP